MRILIVEDEEKIGSFVKRGLREEGFAADLAGDGQTGLDLALSEPYDLVLLDVMLPDMQGTELCRRFRTAGKSAPVIMLTARDAVDDKVAGLDSGADDYLTKPFAFEELLARIRVQLRRAHNKSEGHTLKVADLEIDLDNHEVHRGGQRIDLFQREYSLLEYLMYNSGRVLTRSMIAQHVWDMEYDSFSNVIDVHINRLRKKIDTDINVRLIKTVRGSGYMIQEP